MHTNRASHRRVLCLGSTLALALVACGDDALPPDAAQIDATPPTGTLSLSWTLSDDEGNTIECDQVGAVTVSVRVVPNDAFGGDVEAFVCGALEGTSRGFTPGLYDVEVDLRASRARSLLGETIRFDDIEIVSSQDTPLGAQAFSVAPAGTLSFTVDGGEAGANCASNDDGGAGIIGMRFEVRDSTGNCVPATFDIADGVQAGGTFVNDCGGAPTPFGCIEKDQLVTVENLPSGSLTLESIGQKDGPIDCYSRLSSLTLAGGNLLTELGALILNLENSADCDPDFIFPDAGPADAGLPDAAP